MFKEVVIADIQLGSQITIDTARYLLPGCKLSISSTHDYRIVQEEGNILELSKLLHLYDCIHDTSRIPEGHYVRFVRYKVYKVISTIRTYETHTDIGPIRVHRVTA